MRAPGDVQTIFGVESAIDMVAAELRIDPLELRLRNAVGRGGYRSRRQSVCRPRTAQDARTRAQRNWTGANRCRAGRGRGVALTARHIAGGKTSFIVTAREDGSIAVDTGVAEPGVGTLTVIQRVLAAELGVDPNASR